jgi:hypothetical protein
LNQPFSGLLGFTKEVKMAQKKTEILPAGQTNLFDLLKCGSATAVRIEATLPPAINPVFSVHPVDPALPDGWKETDIHFLLKVLENGPILVADTHLGIPTIHDDFGAEVVHCGFGVMKAEGPGFKIFFDAGGGMERTPSGKGWTRLTVEGKIPGPFIYDKAAVRAKLISYLPATEGLQSISNEPSSSPSEDTAAIQKNMVASAPNLSLELSPAKITIDEQVKEFKRNLGYFTGTEQWTRYACLCSHIVLLTDGALYVAEHGGEDGNTAYWLIDAIASYQGEAALKHHAFQVWNLSVLPPDPEFPPMTVATVLRSQQLEDKDRNPHRHAVLTCSNGDEKQLARQEIDLTDFLPVGDVTIYASVEKHPDISNDRQVMILLLPSEY